MDLSHHSYIERKKSRNIRKLYIGTVPYFNRPIEVCKMRFKQSVLNGSLNFRASSCLFFWATGRPQFLSHQKLDGLNSLD